MVCLETYFLIEIVIITISYLFCCLLTKDNQGKQLTHIIFFHLSSNFEWEKEFSLARSEFDEQSFDTLQF